MPAHPASAETPPTRSSNSVAGMLEVVLPADAAVDAEVDDVGNTKSPPSILDEKQKWSYYGW